MNVIVKPIITEKMTKTTDKFPNRYGFIVEKKANKYQIKKAIEELYGVKVETINTAIRAGKVKAKYTKAGLLVGKTKTTKKAIVTLAEGQTIDFYSNI